MKKFITLILSFILMASVMTGCKPARTENETVRIPDLSWWEENIDATGTKAILYAGTTGIYDDAYDENKVLELLQSLKLYPADPLPHYNALSLGGYGMALKNPENEKYLFVRFYCDFSYASVHTYDIGDITYYALEENPQLREYFESQDFYVDSTTRDKAINFVAQTLQNETPAQIAGYASPLDRFGKLPLVRDDLELVEIGEISVNGEDGRFYDVEKYYFTRVSAAYKDSGGNKYTYMYLFSLAEDENGKMYSLQTLMTETGKTPVIHAAGEFYPDAEIAGYSYAQWLHRLDNPYNNGFYYGKGKGNSRHWGSDIRQCGEIVECIENLKLGETADISIKDYDNELIYTLSLWEENTAFEEGEINLHFMDDFRYVKVCDCENDVSICKEEHPVYKVENPEIILSLFENDPNASYVSTEDFYSLVEYAGKYMRETPVKNLIDQSGTTLVLPDGVTAYGDPAFVKIDRIHSYPDKEEDYNLSFTAMFKYPDENRYLSYQVYMEVEKTAIGWKTNRLRITM